MEVCFCLSIETVGISDSRIVLGAEQESGQASVQVQRNELSVKTDSLSFCLNCSGMISGQNTHR